jgi:hypothetical protein
MQYKDGFGYVYDVPDECVAEFERRHGLLLKIAIFIKVMIIVFVIIFR